MEPSCKPLPAPLPDPPLEAPRREGKGAAFMIGEVLSLFVIL
jgi:hypothetical protein